MSCQLCCSTMFRGGGSRHAFEPLQFPSKPLRPRWSPLGYHFSESRAKSLVKSVRRNAGPRASVMKTCAPVPARQKWETPAQQRAISYSRCRPSAERGQGEYLVSNATRSSVVVRVRMLSCWARGRLARTACIFVAVAIFIPVAISVLARRAWISGRSLGSCWSGRWGGGAPANQQQQRQRARK